MSSTKTAVKERKIPYQIYNGNGQLLTVYLPRQFSWILEEALDNLTLPQILTFISKIFTAAGVNWDKKSLKTFLEIVREENIPVVLVNKKDIVNLRDGKIKLSLFKKWGVIYLGSLWVPVNNSITAEQINLLKKESPDTLVAIQKTTEEQPFIEEIQAKKLKIVYFEE